MTTVEWVRMGEFMVSGNPKGQPRPRAYLNKAIGKARVYEPESANEWKDRVTFAARPHAPAVPYNCPIRVTMLFQMPRHARLRTKNAPDFVPHTGKPDIDNLVKAVLDAMTTAGLWVDDSLVVSLFTDKAYAGKNASPGVIVSLFTEALHHAGGAAGAEKGALK